MRRGPRPSAHCGATVQSPRRCPKVADILTVTSEPSGARVWIQRFDPAAAQTRDSVLLGETPLREPSHGAWRLPARDHQGRVSSPSPHCPRHTAAGHASPDSESPVRGGRRAAHARRLRAHRHGVSCPVARIASQSSMPLGQETPLTDYFIEQVRGEQRAVPRLRRERRLSPAELARFADRSGMPGPRGWTRPGISGWPRSLPGHRCELARATAYCARTANTAHGVRVGEGARNGATAPGEGVMMPWGYVRPATRPSLRANFLSNNPAPVDAYPFASVRTVSTTWPATPRNGSRIRCGMATASWAGRGKIPSICMPRSARSAADASSPALGFRCGPRRRHHRCRQGQGAFRIPIENRTPHYATIAPAAFQSLLEHYRYDSRPLEGSVLETVETPDWTRQKIRYVALEGDTALAYLYLPRQAAAPFQTMVYLSSTAAFVQIRSVPEEVELIIAPNIRGGRAVLAVVFKGMAERAFGPGWEPPDAGSVRFRDLMVLHGRSCAARSIISRRVRGRHAATCVRGHELGRRISAGVGGDRPPLSRRRVAGRRHRRSHLGDCPARGVVHQFRPVHQATEAAAQRSRRRRGSVADARVCRSGICCASRSSSCSFRRGPYGAARGARVGDQQVFGSDVGAGPAGAVKSLSSPSD